MALKLIIEKADYEALDETLRALYEEKDGKFHLTLEGVEDNSGLKKALTSERKLRGDLEKKVKRWEELGKTPEEIQELVEKATKADEDKLKSEGQWDKLRQQMNERHEAALKAKDAVIANKDKEVMAMRQTLESHLIDAQATAAIASLKGVPELLLPHVRKHVKVVEKDGKYDIQVLDKAGEPRVNAKGDPLTVVEMVTEMRSNETLGRAFEGNGQSGGGSSPGGGSGGSPQTAVKRRSELKTEKERAAFVDTHGIDAYKALPI